VIEVRVDSAADAIVLPAVRDTAGRFPGPHVLVVVVALRVPGVQPRRLELGPEWRCDGSARCVAALGEFGRVVLREE
jgi:hypothetical protein